MAIARLVLVITRSDVDCSHGCFLFFLILSYFFSFVLHVVYFFFSSRRRHTRSLCDWSSDVCSSDRPSHRVTGNRRDEVRGAGWEYVHVAIDDASRIAFARIMPDEAQHGAIKFLHAALAYFRSLGLEVKSIMTDNGACYLSKRLAQACRAAAL